ncbi:MAG: YihY/virulence factor BrkB family protein [Bacteroidales bacterium]|jgi:membrane protein
MANPFSWAIDKIKNLNDLIWHTPLSSLTKRKTFLLKQFRILYIAIKGFVKDRVQTQASALTLNTLLSIIPLAAIVFAIAKGFGLEQNLIDELSTEFQSHQEILNWLLNIAQNALQQTKGGYLAGIGVIILLYSVMALLGNIENSFNHIWQISSSRPWSRKFTDYLTIMLIAPVFMILSGSITVFIGTKLTEFISSAKILSSLKPLVGFSIKLVPYFLTWTILTIVYMIIPNTKVNFVPALVAGIIAGTGLKLLQWLYIDMQMGLTRLSAIYGSFAAIPLLIIWLQASWLLILLGAELSFANQNLSNYEQEAEALDISNFQKKTLSVLVLQRIIKNFALGEDAISSSELSKYFNIPVRLVRDIIKNLLEVGLVSQIHIDRRDKESFFQPAVDINMITVGLVLSKLDRQGDDKRLTIKNKDYEVIVDMLKKHDKQAFKNDFNVLVKDL